MMHDGDEVLSLYVQNLLLVLIVVMGDQRDPKNIFQWEGVRFSLPGSTDYFPRASNLEN